MSWVGVGVAASVLQVVVARTLPVAVHNFVMHLVDGPRRIITLSQILPKVLLFPLEKLWVSANCFSSMG